MDWSPEDREVILRALLLYRYSKNRYSNIARGLDYPTWNSLTAASKAMTVARKLGLASEFMEELMKFPILTISVKEIPEEEFRPKPAEVEADQPKVV